MIVGRYDRSATSKNVDRIAAANATTISWGRPRIPRTNATGIEPSRIARPRSVQIMIGRRRSRSTHAPAASPMISAATCSAARIAEISSGPACNTRIAANGRAVRVMSEPKMEIVLADQTARNARSRQSDGLARSARSVVSGGIAGAGMTAEG